MGFGAAPVCSETFTMAEDPKAFCCWGTKSHTKNKSMVDREKKDTHNILTTLNL